MATNSLLVLKLLLIKYILSSASQSVMTVFQELREANMKNQVQKVRNSHAASRKWEKMGGNSPSKKVFQPLSIAIERRENNPRVGKMSVKNGQLPHFSFPKCVKSSHGE